MLRKFNFKNRYWLLVPFICLILLDSVTLLPIMGGALKHLESITDSIILTFSSIALYLLTLFLAWKLYRKITHRSKLNWSILYSSSKKDWKTFWLGVISLLFLYIICIFFNTIFTNHSSTTNQNELVIALKSDTIYKFGTIICSIFLASVVEELLYRGILMRIISPHLSSALSVMISFILFDIMHQGFSIASFIIYGGYGLIYALMYKQAHSLKPSIFLHGLSNLITYLPLL